MERPVKERLIGAAVLMAAAIILIPEMLSGPGRDTEVPRAQTAASGEGSQSGESAIKTYTIDLNQAPGSSASIVAEPAENRAPPPEAPAPAEQPVATPQASPESEPMPAAEEPAQRTSASPPIVAETPRPEPRTEAPQPKTEPTPPESSEPRAVASAQTAPRSAVPTAKGWAVQLGSYSSEATAERLMNEWRAKGQSAFVMPVTSSGKTLYRVRIGPTKDRAGSETALKAVKASTPNAAVVAHP